MTHPLPQTPACATARLATLTPDLMRLARRLADDETQAQDLTQEVLLRLWRKRADLDDVEDLRAYARAALRNLYRAGLRRAPMLELFEEDGGIIDGQASATLALRDLRAAISRLPADQARLIAQIMAGESSPAALAKASGLPIGTVMSRLARARATLRRDMDLAPDTPVAELL